jgi:4-diphosphocytidyl-2-C-methyl-D-erythritol kinase
LTDDAFIDCECDVEGVPTDAKNIAVRAAQMYLEAIGSDRGAHIRIEKRIPMAAGLAGGSTDAAATLTALNRLCGNRLSREELYAIGSRLGADVPFCIEGGCAYSDGKGDVLHPFPKIPENTVFLVACGGEGVSTPWGYGLMDRTYNNFCDYTPKGTERLKNALLSKAPEDFSKHLFNIFEEPVLAERPVAAQIKSMMLDGGAAAAMMSGSGPSVYGIFDSEAKAERVKALIWENGCFAQIAYPTKQINKDL